MSGKKSQFYKDLTEVGQQGEALFESMIRTLLPYITTYSREYIMQNPEKFKIIDHTAKKAKYDFCVCLDDNKQLAEIKTRRSRFYDNVCLELGKLNKDNCLMDYYKEEWLKKNDADWYVFIHITERKRTSQMTIITTEKLKKCLIEGNYTPSKSYGYAVVYIPVADLRAYGGMVTYVAEFEFGDPPAKGPVFVENQEGKKRILLHNLFPEYVERGTPGLEQDAF